MILTQQEKTFLVHILNNRIDHQRKIGWVNPLNRDEVFEHEQLVNLLNKVSQENTKTVI